MYRPNQCTEAHCTKTRAGLTLCAEHLFRWALGCKHAAGEHTHTLAA